jgi:hypothetical protein
MLSAGEKMTRSIDELRSKINNHRLYGLIDDAASLRFFMERHIVCVWDFMSLVKSLQRDIAGTRLPWLPSSDSKSVRLINEIVLDEESDEMPDGSFGSHFELYLRAMEELGCDTSAILGFIEMLREGTPLKAAIRSSQIPTESQAFTLVTADVLEAPLHVRAAAFLYSREDLLPNMFVSFVRALREQKVQCGLFLNYLERHIEVDGERHGPLARRLKDRLCAGDPTKEAEAEQIAIVTLEARLACWDAVAQQLETLKRRTQPPMGYSTLRS